MANGDIAAGRGWSTFPQTQAHSLGYDDINYALDRTAQEVADRTTAVAAKLDAAKIAISTTAPPTDGSVLIWLRPVS